MKPNGIGSALVVVAALWVCNASAMYPPPDPVTPDHPKRLVLKLKDNALSARAPIASGTARTGIASLDDLHRGGISGRSGP